MDKKIIPADRKFDMLADTYEDTPQAYFEQWDGLNLMKALGDVSGQRILDVGCGTGRLLKQLTEAGGDAVGIDISGEMVKKTRERSLTAYQTDVCGFKAEAGFDIVVSVLTLNYIEDKKAMFASVNSLLEPGGIFVISSELQTDDTAIPSGGDIVASPYFPISKDDCITLLTNCGFRVLESGDITMDSRFSQDSGNDGPVGYIIKTGKS
ncbi:class I SAM-dependent DNA methyltransferase [Planctomycetota bacterium]